MASPCSMAPWVGPVPHRPTMPRLTAPPCRAPCFGPAAPSVPRAPRSALSSLPRRRAARAAADSSLQDDALSSDEDLDSAYGPSSIASLLNEANLQTSSC